MTYRPRFGREYIGDELERIGNRLQSEVTAFLIGGGAMSLRNLKDTTKDIDLVVTSDDEYERLLATLGELGYDEVTDIDDEYRKLGARLCIENDDGCRIDLFNEQVADKLVFSEGMQDRSEELLTHRHLSVRLVSLEDIFLFKAVAKRPDDIEDMNTLVQTSLDFESIEREIDDQVSLLGGERFTTYVFESLTELDERYGVQTPLEERITEYNERYMEGFEIRMVLSDETPRTVGELSEKLDLDESIVEDRLQYLEQYGFVERTADGVLDTGKQDNIEG